QRAGHPEALPRQLPHHAAELVVGLGVQPHRRTAGSRGAGTDRVRDADGRGGAADERLHGGGGPERAAAAEPGPTAGRRRLRRPVVAPTCCPTPGAPPHADMRTPAGGLTTPNAAYCGSHCPERCVWRRNSRFFRTI